MKKLSVHITLSFGLTESEQRTSILFPADSIAQLIEQLSGNLKMRVVIPLKSTFLVDFSSVG